MLVSLAAPPISLKTDIASAVHDILSVPEHRLDYARAKLALDALIDPSFDPEATMSELDRMAKKAKRLAGSGADDEAKLNALRKLIYASGPWNGFRPFAYDHSNVRGANVRAKLISHYLATRLGDCISMPILFLILADKIGLRMTLASAPRHFYLHCHRPDGGLVNLEATSGAMPARDAWVRQTRPISDRALASGLYMRKTTRRETVALMATTLLQYLREQLRAEDLIAVARVILELNPRDGNTMVEQALAFMRLEQLFVKQYPVPQLIQEFERLRYLVLVERSNSLIAAAQALGWEYCE